MFRIPRAETSHPDASARTCDLCLRRSDGGWVYPAIFAYLRRFLFRFRRLTLCLSPAFAASRDTIGTQSGHNRDTIGEVSRKRSESLLDYDPPHRLTTERHRPLPRLIRLYLEFLKLLHRAQEPIVGLASSAKAIAR